MNNKQSSIAKQAAAKKAVALVQNGMQIGLGSGSTAVFFIEALIARIQEEKLSIKAIPTSSHTAEIARKGGIVLLNPEQTDHIDLDFDGADRIDAKKRMIKGGGGALMREKIVASMSSEMIVLIDETKQCEILGGFPLPLEISPFGAAATCRAIDRLGYSGALRRTTKGQMFITDNGNYIYDIGMPALFPDPERDNARLKMIPGVLETGFFIGLAGRVIVGHADGSADIIDS